MKSVTIKSIYGKTLAFRDYTFSSPYSGAIEVVYRDDDGNHKGGMVFAKDQVDALRDALALPVPVKSDVGVFFLLRQKKTKDTKIKVCFAESASTKQYTSRRRAEAAAKRQNENFGEWNYFVVEKETV